MTGRIAALTAGTLALILTQGSAWAYPPASSLTGDYAAACGARPADYTGTDATVAGLAELDQRAWDACAAATDHAAAAHTDAAVAHTDANRAHADATAALTGPQPVTVENFPAAATTTAATVTYSAATASQVDDEARTLHGDLWILAGAVVGCFLFDVILRKIWP